MKIIKISHQAQTNFIKIIFFIVFFLLPIYLLCIGISETVFLDKYYQVHKQFISYFNQTQWSQKHHPSKSEIILTCDIYNDIVFDCICNFSGLLVLCFNKSIISQDNNNRKIFSGLLILCSLFLVTSSGIML